MADASTCRVVGVISVRSHTAAESLAALLWASSPVSAFRPSPPRRLPPPPWWRWRRERRRATRAPPPPSGRTTTPASGASCARTRTTA
eukprot:1344265-Prymnesium_polylepis.1